MNFVESAIALLQEAGAPVHVEELCRRALERELLDRPGANPLRSMKGRLTVELKKGAESRLVKVDDEHWALRDGAQKRSSAKGSATRGAARKNGARKAPAASKKTAKAAPSEVSEKQVAKAEKPKTKSAAKGKATKPKAKGKATGEARQEAAEAPQPAEVPELTPEEKELMALYGDDSQGTTPVAALTEYRDEHTADEDRPMLPEIRAERRPRQRRERRSRRRNGERGGRAGKESAESAERAERTERAVREKKVADEGTEAAEPAVEHAVVYGQSDVLALSAREVLDSLPRGQSLPVRQLAQTMRRKKLLHGNPDQLWRMLKGNLLVSEHRRRARGLPLLVVYKGKDLFACAPDSGRSGLDRAASALERAAERFTSAVEEELQDRLARLSAKMLERIVYVYLQSTGWTDISWIKRVDKSSYALAVGPQESSETLIGVRAGPEPVDRRGVGELRAGLEAKDIPAGLLLSPCDLSEEAQGELAREGRPTRILAGRQFVHELMAREVGTTWRHIQVPVLDQDLLSAILG